MNLAVPHIKQQYKWDCWHAAARMIWAYKRNQEIAPLPAEYGKKTGLGSAEIMQLAEQLGMRKLPKVNQSYSINYMMDELTAVGPIFAVGNWFEDGGRHAIVISGAGSDGILDIHDPWYDNMIVRDMSWLNDNIETQWSTPMLYLP